jgi:hypothetical protein
MKVNLAAQVLSASVSSAFELTGKEEFTETAKFCKICDKFFDCLNTRRAGEGKQKRKPDLEPYRSVDDVRFVILVVMFMCLTTLFYSGWRKTFWVILQNGMK